MPLVSTEIHMGTVHLMKALAILPPISQHRTHTQRQRTPTSQSSTMPTKSTIQPTQHQAITIPDLRGMVRLDGMQPNYCPPTTPDTGYNPETASTLGFRRNTSKPGRTVKLRLA